MVFAIDFDGTLCENNYPEIGNPKEKVIDTAKRLKELGHQIILWSCREGILLDEAVKWCEEKGVVFDAVNESLPEWVEAFGTSPKKVGAYYYVDDKNMSIETFENLFE